MPINIILFSQGFSHSIKVLILLFQVSQWLLKRLFMLPHPLKKPLPRRLRSSLILLPLTLLKTSRREHLFSLREPLLLQDSCMKILSKPLVAMMRSKIFSWLVGFSNLLLMLFQLTLLSLLSFFHLSLFAQSTMTMIILTP